MHLLHRNAVLDQVGVDDVTQHGRLISDVDQVFAFQLLHVDIYLMCKRMVTWHQHNNLFRTDRMKLQVRKVRLRSKKREIQLPPGQRFGEIQ